MKRVLSLLLTVTMILGLCSFPAWATDTSPLKFVLTTVKYDVSEHEASETNKVSAAAKDYVVLNFAIQNVSETDISFTGYKACITYDSNSLTPVQEGNKNSDPFKKNSAYNAWGDGTLQPNTETAGEVILAWGASDAAEFASGEGEIFAQILFAVNEDSESSTALFGFNTEKENYYTAGAQTNIDRFTTASLTINGVNPTISSGTTVVLDKTTVAVNGTNGGTIKATVASKKGTDLTANTGITWSVAPADQGVTIGANTGVVTVDSKAKDGAYTVTATADGVNVLKDGDIATATNSFTVTREAAAPATVTVTPATAALEVPTGDAEKAAFEATVLDQYGDEIAEPTLTWEIKDGTSAAPAGITIEGGTVIVTNEAKNGITDTTGKELTVTATSGGKSGTAKLTVKRATAVLTSFELSLTATAVTVPKTDTPETLTVSAVNGKDQYGSDYTLPDFAVEVVDIASYTGISVQGKTVSVSKAASLLTSATTTVTVKGSIGNVEATKTFTVTHEALAADTVEIVGVGDADVIGVNSSKTYTAKVYDQYGNEMNGQTVTWALNDNQDGTNITVSDSTVSVANNDAVDGKTAKLTATCSGKTDSVTITAKKVSIDFDTYFTLKDPASITYGDSAESAFSKTSTSGKATAFISGEATQIDGTFAVEAGDLAAGSKTITVKFTVTQECDYKGTVLTKVYNITVAPKPVTLSWGTSTFDYDGSEKSVSASVTNANGSDEFTLTYSVNKKTNAGSYTASVTDLGNANYTLEGATGVEKAWTVTAKPLTDAMVTLGENPNYTGEEQTITVTIADSAAAITESDYTVTGNKATTVGSYTVTVTGQGNYSGTVTKRWEMLKAEQSALSFASGIADKTYGDAAFDVVVAGGSGTGAFTVTSSDSAVLSVAKKNDTTFAVTVKGAGKAKLTVGKAEDDNYKAATPVESAEITVAALEAALVWDNYADLVYDGNAKNVTATVSNLVGSDSCTVTVTGGTEKNAGSYTATAEALSNANYSLPGTKTQAYTIAPKTLTKDDLEYKSGATTKVYDGSTDTANIVVGVKSGVLASGDTLEIKGAAAYDSKDATTATKIVFTPTAIESGNYRLAADQTVEIAATITAKELTITGVKAVDRSYKEGETTVELTGGELVGVVKDEVVTFNRGSGTMADDAVGARKAVTTAIELTGAYAANYTLTQPTDLTVNIMAAQTIAVNAETGKDKTQVDTPEGATPDEEATAEAVYNISVDTQAVAIMQEASNAAVSDADKVNAIIESAKNNETIKALLEADNGITEDDIQIAAVPFIAIEVKAAELTTGDSEIKLEIDFKLQIKATVGELSDPDKTVDVGEPETMTVNKPITLDIPLPDGFVTGETAFIKHIHDGKTYVYIGTVSGNKLSFTSLLGLSEFTIVPTLDTVAYIERSDIGTIYFETLQAAVDAVENDETIKLMKNAEAATVSREISFTVDATGSNYTYSIAAGSGYSRTEPEGSTYTITQNAPIPSGGGGNASYAITVNAATNGTVAASRKNASVGSTVTITVTPDKGYQLDKLTVLDKNGKEIEVKDLGSGKFSFKMPSGKVSISASFAEIPEEEPPAEEPPADEPAFENPFTDVSETDYYYDAVLWAVENGITLGTSETTFSPEAPVTRAQTVTFLWRAAGCPEPTGNASRFADVEAGSYYEKAVAWAIEQGITQGMTETTFKPNDICTRAQTVTFLSRFAGVTAAETESEFSDVAVTDYFAAAVKWAKDNGVTAGTTETTFSPNDDCIRAQTVTFLYRWMVR